ncbi:hypothetical protein Efla_001364 [Eimeria flavescens]
MKLRSLRAGGRQAGGLSEETAPPTRSPSPLKALLIEKEADALLSRRLRGPPWRVGRAHRRRGGPQPVHPWGRPLAMGPLRTSSSFSLEEMGLDPDGDVLRQLHACRLLDLAAFKVETHARIPLKPYRAGPWPRKEKLRQRAAWVPLRHQQREAPPLALDAHTPRFSAELGISGAEFGADSRCLLLEPFEALSIDEFLGGPGAPPFSSVERKRLLQLETEFADGEELLTRKWWMPHERERWRRSRRLRFLLETGQVVFAADYLGEEFDKDFRKYVGRRPLRRENPWSVPVRRKTDEEEAAAKRGAAEEESRCRARPEDDCPASGPWAGHLESKEQADEQTLTTHKKKASFARSRAGQTGGGRASRVCLLSRLFAACCRISRTAISETESVRLHEAATGVLPSIFAGLRRSKREKHPKDKTVPFHRLKEYGEMITQITSCRMLQDEVDSELRVGWGGMAPTQRKGAPHEHTPAPKGIRDNPNYKLTPDKLRKAAEKLHMPIASEEPEDLLAGTERRRRTVEPSRVLGGGRYAV